MSLLRAEQDLSTAIKQSKSPSDLYVARAALSEQAGKLDSSLSDLGRAIEADPMNSLAFSRRGDIYRRKGDYRLAIADYQKVIELQPNDPVAVGSHALASFYDGRFDKAATSFDKVYKDRPSGYLLLWLQISRSHADKKTSPIVLSGLPASIKVDEWPYSLLELFSGRKSVEQAEGAANTADQKCEAQFYIGEWHLLRGSMELAVKALKSAVSTCPKDFSEYGGAVAELARLGP